MVRDKDKESFSQIALSTSWNADQNKDGHEIINEILKLGIEQLELNYFITDKQIGQIYQLHRNDIIKVVSLHNICPVPPGYKNGKGDGLQLSSTDEAERQKAVQTALNTVHWAEKFGARVVVLHPGQAPMAKKDELYLADLLDQGLKKSRKYQSLFAQIRKDRERLIKPHFQSLKRSLDEITEKLPSGIKLGLENRYYYYEIPSITEMEELLTRYGAAVGYWHDTGHAHTLEVLGFYSQNQFINQFGSHLIGIHLHDAVNTADHQTPGRGEIDFTTFKPYLNEKSIKVIELRSNVSAREILAGVVQLKSSGLIG